jgi:Sec-independent protein translocase protein TatA
VKSFLCAVVLLGGTVVLADDTMKTAGEKIDKSADATKSTVKKAGSDTADATQKAAKDVSTATKKAASSTSDATQKAAKDTSTATKKAASKTADAVN